VAALHDDAAVSYGAAVLLMFKAAAKPYVPIPACMCQQVHADSHQPAAGLHVVYSSLHKVRMPPTIQA
jgi:hypothetical protein